jgi:hypothetical protein
MLQTFKTDGHDRKLLKTTQKRSFFDVNKGPHGHMTVDRTENYPKQNNRASNWNRSIGFSCWTVQVLSDLELKVVKPLIKNVFYTKTRGSNPELLRHFNFLFFKKSYKN